MAKPTLLPKLLLGAVLLGTLAYAYSRRDWIRYGRLYRESVLTQGWVVGTRPPLIDYAFMTDKKMITATDTGGFGNPPAEDLKEGDDVIVYFSPRDPTLSCLGGPSDRLREQDSVFFMILMPAMLIGGGLLWRELGRHGPLLPKKG